MSTETEEKKKEEKEQVVSPETQFEMQQWLAKRKALEACQDEIQNVLEKYSAVLIVDPDSPVRIMAIKVVLTN